MKLIKVIPGQSEWKWGKLGPKWSDKTLIGFDAETTSQFPLQAKILSASIIIDVPGNEPIVYEWLLNQTPIPIQSISVHGITEEKVIIDGMDPAIGIKQIIEKLYQVKIDYPNIPIVIVNANYDCSVLNEQSKEFLGHSLDINKIPFIIDSLTLDRIVWPYRRGRRILSATLSAYNGIIQSAHTSTGDTLAGIKLVRLIGEKYPYVGHASLSHLQKVQADAHKQWCDQYEEYQHIENPDFMIGNSKNWPIINGDNND